jgi:hypothetical protein
LTPGDCSTHLHTNSTQNIEDGTYITITRGKNSYKEKNNYMEKNNNYKEKIGKCGPCSVFASYTLAHALQLRKKHGKTSVRVETSVLHS